MNNKSIKGYIFTSKKDDIILNSNIGDIIEKERKPPFLVVNHEIYKIIVTRWPGKLFFVEVIDPVDNTKLKPGVKLRKDAHYTRAFAIKILEELPVANLFGENGEMISRILDRISVFSKDEVLSLAKLENKEANELFSEGWNRWLKINDSNSIHHGYNHERVILIHTEKSCSPINYGLSIISSHYNQKIKELIGDEAFYIDEEGDECMQAQWASALNVLFSIAMGYGASFLFNESELKVLTSAWEELFELR